ncbi:MAG: aldolase/citrate lyase family protein [Candidatus Bathyarchaeia archaeon]
MELDFLTSGEAELRKMAEELKDKYGCIAVKLGTEVEDCSFEYIAWVQKLVSGLLPVVVKIGGPEARNDIRQLSRMGVGGLIAPMVESPYGLLKYVTALRDIIEPAQRQKMIKGINAETVNCYRRIDEILGMPEAKELNQVTVGRSDLSESVGKKVDDPEVIRMTAEITKKAQAAGLVVSVGGGITPANAKRLVEQVKPDKINSRHIVISPEDAGDISESFRKALAFESAMMKYEVSGLNARIEALQKRIGTLDKRVVAA